KNPIYVLTHAFFLIPTIDHGCPSTEEGWVMLLEINCNEQYLRFVAGHLLGKTDFLNSEHRANLRCTLRISMLSLGAELEARATAIDIALPANPSITLAADPVAAAFCY
ncbi:hypothetical protein Ancab_038089, partial [Ancistrocladus abbreviatus]